MTALTPKTLRRKTMLTHQYVYYYQEIILKLNMHEMYIELYHIE